MKVLIKFRKAYINESRENMEKAMDFYKSDYPIAHRSLGSVVAMKDSDWWLDYNKVTGAELLQLISHISKLPKGKLKDNIVVEVDF